MNRRQKIIISVIGIFIILLALVGITYGYFLTRIQGNTNTTSITVTTADLKLVYGDGNGNITAEAIIPGTTIDTKTFTVYNDGNATVSNYNVYLENVVNTFSIKDDVVYTLTCETDDETNSPCTNEVTTETIFPSSNTVLLTNTLAARDTHTYTLTVTYKETNTDQSIDMDKTISGKINLYDTNTLNNLTMSHYILSNGALVQNTTTEELVYDTEYTEKTTMTKVSNGTDITDVGIFTAPDDYGTSYYYRGTAKNNYVNFAGFTWRIVRINGDGSVRLILDGALDSVDACDDTTICTASSFNSNLNDNAYVGYMYGLAGASENVCVITADGVKSIDTNISDETSCTGEWMSGYDATHQNLNDSTIKKQLDSFYEKYLNTYKDYISDTIFCGDKSLASSTIGSSNTALGYGTNKTYYAATERLYHSTGTTSITTATPTLECAKGATNTYSRYTVDSYTTTNGVNTNGDLTYPIALLSADELVMAGAFNDKLNNSFYLNDGFAPRVDLIDPYYWWTMSTYAFNGSTVYMFFNHIKGTSFIWEYANYSKMLRPVINLRADALVVSGDGTSGSGAYTVKLAS